MTGHYHRRGYRIIDVSKVLGDIDMRCYDRALAEYEVRRRHFPETVLDYEPPAAEDMEKETEAFLRNALRSVR
jgi:hypothetical protein